MTSKTSVIDALQAAVASHQAGDLAKAKRLYRKVLKQQPDQPDALNLLGVIAHHDGDLDEAVALYDQAMAAAPALATLPFNKGNALRDAERLPEAHAAYEAALAIDPGFHDAQLNLGVLLQENDDTDQALKHFLALINLAPKNHPNIQKAHYNIGKCRQAQGRLEEAQAELSTALTLNPNDHNAHFALANVYADMNQHTPAIDSINTAIKLNPNWSEAYANLGNFLCSLDRQDEALEKYERALALDSSNVTARVNRGLALLSLGQLAEGWADYQKRADSDAPFYRTFENDIPQWDGEHLTGKKVLIWNEQGLGEEILYAGLLREFAACAGQCTLRCSVKLRDVFEHSFEDINNLTILSDDDFSIEQRSFDVQTSLVGLGHFLRPSMSSFPPPEAYLRWDINRASRIRRELESRFGEEQRFVGLSWSSANPMIGGHKSIPLASLAPLLTTPDVTFINVQYGGAAEETRALPETLQDSIFAVESIDLNGNLDDTLCLLASLDQTITCSNSTAHLAAAAGLPTWVMMPPGQGRIWYWFLNETNSPWYKKVRVFRQSQQNSLEQMIREVSMSLTK